MNFLLGGGKRAVVVASTIIVVTGLSACSSSDDAPKAAPKPVATTSATPDQAAVDVAAVVDLANRYWEAVVTAENSGNDDPAQFADVATPEVAEGLLSVVADYKKLNLLRVGRPTITDVAATVMGDSAQIVLCKNEDDWTAEVDGEPVPDDKKYGPGPWGAQADRVDGRWLVTEIVDQDEAAKPCG